MLENKPVNNRKARPEWAMEDRSLMLKCVGKSALIRFQIAQMYWQQNMTARDIATSLDMTIDAVNMVILRLSKSK